jgi:uncharacterized integral membrane protein (TIGR00698 family)
MTLPTNSEQPHDHAAASSSPSSIGTQATAGNLAIDSLVNKKRPRISEDWLAIVIGALILGALLTLLVTETATPDTLKSWISKPGGWKDSIVASFTNPPSVSEDAIPKWLGILASLGIMGAIATLGAASFGRLKAGFFPGLIVVLTLSTLAYSLSGQATIENLSLEYVLWALVLGLIISNTVGTPNWLRSAAMTEFFIKTGLVIYGAEILFGKLLALGLPGICVAWIVTPIVLITTFWFGQKVLKIESATLNMVISADMSVCGVSAAIATAAACKAKKEELSLAIGLSLGFTVVMMIVMPPVANLLGLSSTVSGAWLGGTIDATGAVAAAGAMMDETAAEVAITVKMIQNILIGVVAFAVAWYWVRFQEPSQLSAGTDPNDDAIMRGRGVGIDEVWRRFPRFILGFIVASIFFSTLAQSEAGEQLTKSTIGSSKVLRGWLFCMAFVSIGLETNFLQLAKVMRNGKPMLLYVCGQTLNLCLTLAMAYVVFEILFPSIGTPTPVAN